MEGLDSRECFQYFSLFSVFKNFYDGVSWHEFLRVYPVWEFLTDSSLGHLHFLLLSPFNELLIEFSWQNIFQLIFLSISFLSSFFICCKSSFSCSLERFYDGCFKILHRFLSFLTEVR